MAVMLLAGGTSAAQAAPADGDMSTQACETVSGGKWCYGSRIEGIQKHCWSNFKDDTYHSATAVIGSDTTTRYALVEEWANASAYGGWNQTCYAYYRPNIPR